MRVSTDSAGGQGNQAYSGPPDNLPSVSADGRYVAFTSDASNLVPGDTNGATDVFLKDTVTGTITLISDSAGEQVSGHIYSDDPSISANGRYVAFESSIRADAWGDPEVFLKDTQTGATTSISTADSSLLNNNFAPSISADGRYVTFYSNSTKQVAGDTNGAYDVFLRDTQTGAATLISSNSAGEQGDGNSRNSSVSADGRYVAFDSEATNLVADDTNGKRDVFLKDIFTDATTIISTDSAGGQGNNHSYEPSVSADGRYVAFTSDSSNLALGDTNGNRDVFLKDTLTGATTLISSNSAGQEDGVHASYNPTISADGRYVAFDSYANNLVWGDGDATRDSSSRTP